MASEDELLQRIAAAAIPRRLGRLYSRYGQPSPELGMERTAPVLGREAILGGRGVNAEGQAGRPESLQPTSDEEKVAEARAQEMADEYRADAGAGAGSGIDYNADLERDEDPAQLGDDHAKLMSGIGQLGIGDSTHAKVAADSTDMGPEDFWRLYGSRLEGQGISRDDFFEATGTEP